MRDLRFYLVNPVLAASSPDKKLMKTSAHFVMPMNPQMAIMDGSNPSHGTIVRNRIVDGIDYRSAGGDGGQNPNPVGVTGGTINLPNPAMLPQNLGDTLSENRSMPGIPVGATSCNCNTPPAPSLANPNPPCSSGN